MEATQKVCAGIQDNRQNMSRLLPIQESFDLIQCD